MGLIGKVMGLVFGSGGNVIRETAEVFRENTEAAAEREARAGASALAQFAAEFERQQRRGFFDRLMDAVNRMPRPAMALGTLGLFVAAMVDPVWFSVRMQGIALVPEPLWWLMGAIVSFYFGARHQAKGQEFKHSIAETLARTPEVVRNIETLMPAEAEAPRAPAPGSPNANKPHPAPEAAFATSVQQGSSEAANRAGPPSQSAAAGSGGSLNAALNDWRTGVGG